MVIRKETVNNERMKLLAKPILPISMQSRLLQAHFPMSLINTAEQ